MLTSDIFLSTRLRLTLPPVDARLVTSATSSNCNDVSSRRCPHRRGPQSQGGLSRGLLYPGLHAGFESVRDAVGRLDRAREDRVLVISATPGLTAKWLVPRLWRFMAAHPDIDARISASLRYADHCRRRRRR